MPSVSASHARSSATTPVRPGTATELAILNHPDQRTSWIVVMTATLRYGDSDLTSRIAEGARPVVTVGRGWLAAGPRSRAGGRRR
jgi:hypothetical protein